MSINGLLNEVGCGNIYLCCMVNCGSLVIDGKLKGANYRKSGFENESTIYW